MTLLTLVRHGETDWNRNRRIQGSTDIPLNDTGREQARAAGLALAEVLDRSTPTVIASSDLSRASETARIIAGILDLPEPRAYPELRERGYGDAEGLTDTEFFDRWGPWATAEVPGAEPWPEVTTRALRGIQEAVADARALVAPEDLYVIAVAHGALIRTVISHASAGEFPEPGHKLANGSAHTFRVEGDLLSLLTSSALPV
ncbi:histidine phosphatase family protein [Microbacterium sp. 179-I 1D1 NHS]|uniref:histidine phosphatase family protein n=1 Tax=Microbacterium sp. 179-I 1D1 NHS TaxID=3374298 RepID=UPI0038790579